MNTRISGALVALVISAAHLEAQTALDVYVGHNSATQQSSETTRDMGSLGGFIAGVTALRQVTTWFALETGALYSEKGSRSLAHMYRMNYIEIPLTVRLTTKQPLLGVQPYAIAGVASAQRVGCSGWTMIASPSGPSRAALSCDEYRRTDLGRALGVGASHNRTHVQYRAEVRKTVGRDILVHPSETLRNDVTSFFLIAQFRLR
jgi:hypothetical protein